MRRGPGALAAGLALAACAAREPAPRPTRHLIERFGDVAPLRLGAETRPAIRLRSGEQRHVPVAVAAGDRLVFAFGFAEPEPPCPARLRVEADAALVLDERFEPGPAGWRLRAVDLPATGAERLGFEVTAECPGVALDPEAARFAIGSPRLHDPRPRPDRRVLIWISQDTLRADHLGGWGYPRATSPHLDRRAAADWALFEQAVATASWTLPSLASQFSSRYPSFHGAVMGGLASDAPSLFEALSADGFTVLGSTGNEFVSAEHGLTRGFDAVWYVERRARGQSRELLRRLAEWEGGDLALFVHFLDPHLPYRAPLEYHRRFDEQGYSGTVQGGHRFYEADAEIGPADRQHLVDLYDGEIAYNDDAVERLLDGLAGQGLLQGAVIAYSSDHGEEFREHGGWVHGGTLYEEVVRVPLALRVPGVAATRVARPVSLIDLAPTLLDALRVPLPDGFQGRSLLPLLRGGERGEEPIFAETVYDSQRRQVLAVRSGPLKYLLTVARGGELPPLPLREELYDLGADPGERHDQLGARRAEADALRRVAFAYLARARAEGGPGRPVDLSPETEERLRAWGYIQ